MCCYVLYLKDLELQINLPLLLDKKTHTHKNWSFEVFLVRFSAMLQELILLRSFEDPEAPLDDRTSVPVTLCQLLSVAIHN